METKHYDPTSKSLVVRARWTVAWWLNKLPRTCWSNLVSWALGDRKLWDPGNHDDVRQNYLCGDGVSRTGSCYCGKLRKREQE